jgi:hypothetical protein
MEEIRKKAINHLMQRRRALQEQYDALINEPASYGITGSVNATNRGLDELRSEIVAIDAKINALLSRTSVAGMAIKYPDYSHTPLGGF